MNTSTKIFFTSLFIFIKVTLNGQDPFIQNIVNTVSESSIINNIEILQDMERCSEEMDTTCVNFIMESLQSMDFDTVFLHNYRPDLSPNIIAVKYGLINPDSIIVFGAHYDTSSPGYPGADDNASGVSGVLEASLRIQNHFFKNTLMVVLFSAEEEGAIGSKFLVDSAINNNLHITGMINLDMISYLNPENIMSVTVSTDSLSLPLKNKYINSLLTYVPDFPFLIDSINGFGSDHLRFWINNIPAITLHEEFCYYTSNHNPYIHSINDTIGLSVNSPLMAKQITKSAVAVLLELLEPFSVSIEREENILKMELELFPNPTNEIINITSNTTISGIQITDVYGRVINNYPNINKNSIEIRLQYPGIYFAKVMTVNDIIISKIIRN